MRALWAYGKFAYDGTVIRYEKHHDLLKYATSFSLLENWIKSSSKKSSSDQSFWASWFTFTFYKKVNDSESEASLSCARNREVFSLFTYYEYTAVSIGMLHHVKNTR